MVPAGNKAKHLSSVNHTTKKIHHHHHHHKNLIFDQLRDRGGLIMCINKSLTYVVFEMEDRAPATNSGSELGRHQ